VSVTRGKLPPGAVRNEYGEVVVPDGTTGDPTQPPANPGDQIEAEIALGRVVEVLTGLFGGPGASPQAGGGGQDGKFMFASLADLDSVIAQWQNELQAIMDDGEQIRNTATFIREPADDGMSRGHAKAARESLTKLLEHNVAMRDYADEYIKKLQASRQSMANADLNGRGHMNSVDRS
jgi:hypothetical protein